MTNTEKPAFPSTDVAYVELGGLRVATPLAEFCVNEALPGTGVAGAEFWAGLAEIVAVLAPRHAE